MEKSISITKARKEIYKLANKVNEEHRPIYVTNKSGNNMVIISEDDWRSIEETIYLNSIPGMAESIIAAKNEPIKDCIPESEVEW